MNRALFIAVALIAGSYISYLPGASPAQEGSLDRRPQDKKLDADQAIRKLEEKREKIKGLAARVIRETKGKTPGQTSRETITIHYRAPDRLRTEIVGKKPRTVIINGDTMRFFFPDLEVVEEYALKDDDSRQRAMYEMSWGLTSPIMVLVRGMNRTLVELESGQLLVKLVPDNPEINLTEISATIDPDRWEIETMNILQPNLPPVTLTVTSWNPDTEPDLNLFSLEVPKGWDLFQAIDESPQPQPQL